MPGNHLLQKIEALKAELESLHQNKEVAQIALQLFELFANRVSCGDFLYSAAEVLNRWSGCRNVGIRLLNQDGFIPYHAAIGFSPAFIAKENMLSLERDNCVCIRAIAARFGKQELRHTTPRGSFYCCDAALFLAGLSREEAEQYRGDCILEGFKSIAVIPVKRQDRILGAIHLADQRKNRLSLPIVEMAESLAQMIGEAIHHFNTERALHQKDIHIREQYAELDQIYTHSPYGLCLMDRGLKLIRVNQSIGDFIGLPEADVLGKSVKEVIHKLSPDIERAFAKVIRTGTPVQNIETLAVSPQAPDNERYFLVSLYPQRSTKNEIKGVNAIVREITKNRRMEKELQKYAELLEEKNRELQDFAFVASHDLQEPLRKIQVFGALLQKRYAGFLDGNGLDYLNRMQNASCRMQDLINDLLEYSRVNTGSAPFLPVDLNQIVHEVLGDLEIPIRESGARLEIGDLPTIDADATQMRQVFQNLIGNALKYSRGSPVVKIYGQAVSPASNPPPPDVPGEFFRIFVMDNGIGFHEKYAERIFKPLERLHDRSRYEGTGMGLAIVQKIVNRHGGKVTVKSRPDHGATFVLTLPSKQQ